MLLQYPLKNFGHVFHYLKNFTGNKNGSLLLQRQNDGVTRPRIQLENFAAEFILHVKNDAGEIGAVVDVIDNDAL